MGLDWELPPKGGGEAWESLQPAMVTTDWRYAMTDDHFTENPGERNRRIGRERDNAFIPVLDAAKKVIETRATLDAELKRTGGMAHISTGMAVLLSELNLVHAMKVFKLPEWPPDEY